MKHKDTFVRELFILFYLLFLCTTIVYKMTGISLFRYALIIAQYTYIPGMLFAGAYDIGNLDYTHPDEESFRRIVLKKAGIWMLHFYLLGFLRDVFLEHRDPFTTIKNLLALIRIPGLVSVFLSLGIFYALFAFLWRPVVKGPGKKLLIPALSLAGILCIFIPDGLIGYGAVGVFTGADRFGAAPILPYLYFIFFGAYLSTMEEFRFYERRFLFFSIILLALCGAMILMGFRKPAFTIAGVFLAWIGVVICSLLYSAYEKAETAVAGMIDEGKKRSLSFYLSRQDSRFFRGFFYLAGYTLLFILMACFIFVPYIQQHRTLIWSVDGLGQYLPKIYRFMDYIPSVIKDILHGNMNFKQYDFSSGLGATVAVSYDPLYWLWLLFRPSQIEAVYSGMILLRFFLAGLAFSAMVLFFGGSHLSAYTSSMVYAFSGYALYAGTKHGQFLNPLILLPLLVIAMELVIREKRWAMMTILVAVSLLCSYYFLYMNTIAIGVYFVIRILCTKEYRNFITFITRGLIITGSYILGASMGIIALFTSFASYMGSSRTEGGSLDSFLSTTSLFYRPEWISDSFISFISDSFTPGMWLKLGFAPMALLALVLLFTRKSRKELRPLFLLFSLCCIFPISGFIFSGFSSVNNRWCYIYACLVAFILAEMLGRLDKLSADELKIMTGIVFLYGGIIFFSTKYHTDKVFGAFGLLTMTLIILYLVNYNQGSLNPVRARSLIMGVTMLTIIFNANMFITAGSDTGTHLGTYVAAGTSKKNMTSSSLKYLDEVTGENEEFFRATNLRTNGNQRSGSLILGYNDISTFTSTLGSGIVDYNTAMGNCGWNIVSIYSYNTRTILNELAGVRFIGTDSKTRSCIPFGYHKVLEKKDKQKTKIIYENDYALPLGYTYDNILSSEDISVSSAAEKQELTMMTAIVNSDQGADNSNLDNKKRLNLSAHEIEIKDVSLQGVTIDEDQGLITAEKGGSITFSFNGEKNAETYVSLKGDIYHEKDAKEHFLKTEIQAEGTSFLYKFRIDSYSTGQEEFLFNLGYHEEAIDSCTFTFQAAGQLKYDDLAIYVQPMDHYPEQAAALREEALENVVTDTNLVTGDITVSSDKMLCITLPYQAGWTAYVDGEKTSIQRINYQYMGLNLKKGHHQIRLTYRIPGIRYAFLITGGGIAVFIVLLLISFILKKRKGQKRKEE